MARVSSRLSGTGQVVLLLSSLVVSSVLLPDCALKDDYYVRKNESGGVTGRGGVDIGGESAVSLAASGGTPSAGTMSSAGASAGTMSSAGASAGEGGDTGSGREGCVSAMNQEHEYAFCFSALIQAEARANCGARGMTLAVIDDDAENAWIAATLATLYQGDRPLAFIGANDVATEGEWRRADGVIFWRGGAAGAPVAGNYANWEAGQPSDPGATTGSEDCLSIGISSGTWNDVSCDTELPYVCEPR